MRAEVHHGDLCDLRFSQSRGEEIFAETDDHFHFPGVDRRTRALTIVLRRELGR